MNLFFGMNWLRNVNDNMQIIINVFNILTH